ncbi:glycosyltransferase involved in cell wall biosynthesis [Saccharothrix ecbatanensis]|uniref:Glycosyltransferase involved in cell wall biosynthesis n=1 Tax=Saccharothrix ecbatanensis TaxID=1105145 RepID=A0A7W9HLN5_9PSEU|nr:glycosyltransferase [Saccharothrix ecbatanensis]MBB5804391.1 glycosyltransferase involved in cell wall biosynthesis [Saccharothrix ecbatanensis]
MTWFAVLLAVLGAVFFAFAARLQHEAVRASEGALRVRELLRRPRWLLGLVLLVVGAGVHAAALGMAPLSVVQPVGVVAIGITAVLDGRRRELPAVAWTTFGVGAFVLLAAGSATSTAVVPEAELKAALVALGLIAVPGLVGVLSTRPAVRALGFGAAGGVAYGFVSVLMRSVSQDVQQGGLAWTTAFSAAGIVAALLVGGWFIQHAYASGPPHVAVACLTVVDPLVAVGIGAGLLGEATRTSLLVGAAELVCAAVAVGGVVVLARTRNLPEVPTRSETTVTNGRAMRIVIAAETFPPDVNGAARFAHSLATGLAGRGHDVHVICVSPDGPARTEPVDGITVHRLRSHRTPFHRSFRIGLPWEVRKDVGALLEQLRPDLVHVQAHFVVGRYVLRQAAALGIATVATNHFMPENLFGHAHVPAWLQGMASRWAWRDLGRVFGLADVVTAPTPRAVQLLHDNGFPSRAVPVSCGIDIDRYRSRKPVRHTDAPTVLFVGRLDEEKRVDELLRALALVPRLHAEIVGDGSCRGDWELLARDLGIADRVRFRGFVSESELLDAYAGADVFCMPGIAELQSLATMEAMAAGKPVVVADAMALPHLCKPGRNGWLFTPGDVRGLADRLHAVTADPAVTARMGAASSDLIAAHAIDTTLETFESLYARALGLPVLVQAPALAA